MYDCLEPRSLFAGAALPTTPPAESKVLLTRDAPPLRLGCFGDSGGCFLENKAMTQAKRNQQRADRRSRMIEVSPATAKIVAKATAHRVVDGSPNYVPLTDAFRTHKDAGTWNYARKTGYKR